MRSISYAAIAALSLGIVGPAKAEWLEAKSDHFIVYADASQGDLRQLALQLERFDSATRKLMNLPNPRLTDAQRVMIFVLPTMRDMAKLSGAQNVGGFYTSRVEGSQAFVPSARDLDQEYSRVILYHEYTHHLQLQRAKHAIPRWLTEGFADFTSTAAANSDGSVTFGAQAPGRQFVPGHYNVVPVDEMIGETYGKLSDRGIEDFYTRSWRLVSYMQGDPARRAQLGAYLDAIGNGALAADAAKTAFGDISKLDRRLNDYTLSPALYGFKVPAQAINVGHVAIRPLSAGEAAMMPVRIRSTAGVTEKTAPIVLAEAQKIAARYPGDAAVQSRLAEAAFDAKDYAAAAAAANKALSINPNDVHALNYRGWTALTVGKEKPDAANWDAIRADFIRATSLDTQNPLSLYLFYQTFVAARKAPSANAVEALLYAVTLAPQDTRVRMAAVGELLVANRMAEAKDMFRWVAYSPHQSDASRTWSQKVLGVMEKGDGKAALAVLSEAP